MSFTLKAFRKVVFVCDCILHHLILHEKSWFWSCFGLGIGIKKVCLGFNQLTSLGLGLNFDIKSLVYMASVAILACTQTRVVHAIDNRHV